MKRSFLVQSLIISLLTLSMPSAYALNKCKAVKYMQAELEQKKFDLSKIEQIQAQQIEAKEIADRILKGDEITEILLLAESIDEEVSKVEKDQSNAYKKSAASIGSIILSSYIIRKLNKGNPGFKARFLAQLFSKDKRFVRQSLNVALVVSVASTFWLAYSIKQNMDKKEMLVEIIDKLNHIKDLTEQILDLREDIEEREVTLNITTDQLLYEKLIEIDVNETGQKVIKCAPKKKYYSAGQQI